MLKATSNRASGTDSDSARPFSKAASTLAFLAFLIARAIIAGEGSIPTTEPVGPTCRLAAIASVPVPHPTSSTDSPG